MGIRTRIKCLDLLISLVFVLIRLCLLLIIFFFSLPQFFRILGKTWSLNKVNWWQSPDEPFFSSESFINSFICWGLWLYFSIIMYFLIFYGTILSIVLVVQIIKGNCSCCKQFCKVFCFILRFYWIAIKHFLLGSDLEIMLAEFGQAA